VACTKQGDCLRLKNVVVRNVEEVVRGHVIIRTLDLWYRSDAEFRDPHRVVQYQYKGWPDHGVPNNAEDIRRIVYMVDEQRANDCPPHSPIVVHCSAGVGRTGTFIAIHQNIMQMKRMIEEKGVDPNEYCINLYQDVLQMRGCRSGMVQQPAQYTFCYKAIAEEAAAMKILKSPTGSSRLRFVPSDRETVSYPISFPSDAAPRSGRLLSESSARSFFESSMDDDEEEEDEDDIRRKLTISRIQEKRFGQH